MERAFPLEVKAVTESGEFDGLASTYDTKDGGNDVVQRGAFTRTLTEKGNQRPLLWSHDVASPIGLATLTDTAEGLALRGVLDLDTQSGRESYSRLKKGIVKGLSIGYRSVKDRIQDGARHLLDLDFFEVSLVTFPMNERALVHAVKSQVTTVRDYERFLRSAGWSKAEAAKLGAVGWRGLQQPDAPADGVDTGELLAWLKSETARHSHARH